MQNYASPEDRRFFPVPLHRGILKELQPEQPDFENVLLSSPPDKSRVLVLCVGGQSASVLGAE